MTATPATLFGPNMTLLVGNAGGKVQQLPQVNLVGGKERIFVEKITLAAQVNGSIFGVARLPLPAVLLGITVLTSVTLGSSTLKFGNAGNGNSAIYGAAAALTATNTPTTWAASGTYGQQITSGYDCQSGAQVTAYAPGAAGGLYEEVIMTVGGADLPGSGTVLVLTRYMID